MRPIIGISCCMKGFGAFNTPNHAASDTYIRAVLGPVGGVPVLIPAAGECVVLDLLAHLDGLILTGSRSNVHPTLYEGPPHAEGTPEDVARDSTTMPLIRAAVDRGLPVLAICRGLQEMNVALGGSLDQRIQDLPDRMDHSTPTEQALPQVRTGKAHTVRLAPGSPLALIAAQAGAVQGRGAGGGQPASAHDPVPFDVQPVTRLGPAGGGTGGAAGGASGGHAPAPGAAGGTPLSIPVNSLHNQGIARLAPRLTAEGWAPDGTIEAVRVTEARGFALGVQWHPEYDWQSDPVSRALLVAFGREAAGWASRRLLASAAE
ncbi:gamma-glutamyl-gamma-aminobutyrate hydrolase family protein [Roseomonas sp. NAR14]|uniref:Gamma-glutamyl-gamma-aminobutyrate hydrolase family protein n=1 Tax=Roseomonas acroporae TaxID=2937791 RepID=A0A9X1Y7A1_9PROT|nr:gamma-glutamyl-gamma-aminobutyrate hydrolase family protein [Roseomonas acroporae]MCK8783377.1 gamma-glutamyl-gamma-aminobutyrate hydrolase family protein [Roseomonas acroporae]